MEDEKVLEKKGCKNVEKKGVLMSESTGIRWRSAEKMKKGEENVQRKGG